MYDANRTRRGRIIRRAAMVRTHPLNRQRAAWWLALPGLGGGGTLRDLLNSYPAAITGATWGASPTLLAASSLTFGANQYARMSAAPILTDSPGFTVAGCFRYGIVDSEWRTVIGKLNSGSTNRQFQVLQNGGYNGTTNGLSLFTNARGDGPSTTPYALTAGQVYWFAAIHSGTTNTIYVGTPQSPPSPGTNGTGTGEIDADSGANPIEIGAQNGAESTRYLGGPVYYTSLWTRPLTVAEVAMEWSLFFRGYPGVLARDDQALAAAMYAGSTGTGITVSFALLSQASSALFNANATLGVTFQAASQNAAGSFNANATLGITLGAASQNATSSFNINTTLGVTLGAASQDATTSINVSATLGVTLNAASDLSITSLNVIATSGIGCTLEAAADPATTSINTNAILQTTFTAAAQPSSTSFNTNATLQTTFTAAAQSASTSINTNTSLLITFAAASQTATALFNAIAGTGVQKVIASTIERVFQPLVNLLQTQLPSIFNTSNCIVSIRDEIPEAPGSPFCWIFPGSFDELTAQVSGSGLYVSGVSGIFTVRLRVRNIMDVAYTETQALLNPNSSLGLYALVLQIINVLQLCFPLDASGNFLCEEPPKLISISEPMRVPVAREWVGVDMNFHVSLYMKTSVT